MSEGIAGKVVVITGASSGLGAATARHLSKEGATAVLAARRLDRVQALAVETGVVDRKQVQRLVDTSVETFGRIDVMLNNAGLMPLSPLERLKVDEWDRSDFASGIA